MTRRLSKVFWYLERRDIPRYKLPSLEETGFISFYHLFLSSFVGIQIDPKRAEKKIDQTLAIKALDLYLELNDCSKIHKAKEEKMDRSPDVLSKKVNLVSSDGVVFEVDLGLALMSKRFEDIIDIETIPIGDVDTISVDEVNSKMLSMVVEYCKKHDKRQKYVDIKIWDAQFVDVDPKTLDDLETHARYLKIERLGNLAFYKEG
ncbi:SKP1-like protein 14 isoform X1 [Medicago truncatula]|uniref:SKP1-like protein 14 isoform X1 n=2 Tax=Medicago truncatula TaxID=3880 RepID=UPI000D2F2DE3|nr:SKP1-like protein 14 isoform X1 [Medicago truncatula]XP_024637356.1 SKP1-like protein 14 isoform X1 [Medicago truncatula]XP_024637357.1 SKP1-like protein 14 isoform X1 [Medicago truncatula]